MNITKYKVINGTRYRCDMNATDLGEGEGTSIGLHMVKDEPITYRIERALTKTWDVVEGFLTSRSR